MQPRVVQTAPLAHGLGKQLRRVLIDEEAEDIAKMFIYIVLIYK